MISDLHDILDVSMILLTRIFFKMKDVNIELMRTSEVAAVLLDLGLQKDKEIKEVLEESKNKYNKNNLSEIIYCLQFLHKFPEAKEEIKKMIRYLLMNMNEDGGIGRFVGDRSRIPVSWRFLESLYLNDWPYDENIKKQIAWMGKEWTKDSAKGGLSYKCTGILIANSYYPYFDKHFISNCIKWVLEDQNDDGGWGPRKNSPVGSRPSDTALALRALSNYKGKEIEEAIQKGIKWLIQNRLESGFWKEHEVEKPLMYISIFLNKYLKNETKFH